MNLLKRIARRLVERDIIRELGYRLRSDAGWFDQHSDEYRAVHEIGDRLVKYEHYNIGDIREQFKLTSPARPYYRCVKLYPNGDFASSLESSSATYALIAKVFEKTMAARIWSETHPDAEDKN